MCTRYFLFAVLCCASVAWAADPPKPDAGAAPAKSPVERLKENPNDTAALNEYMMTNIRHLMEQMDSDAKAAEQMVKEMKQVIDSLKPNTDQAKQLLERAKSVIPFYEQQLELARLSLEELGKRLTANPDDQKAFSMFFQKVRQQVGGMARSEPDKAEADLKAAKEVFAKAESAAKDEAAKTRYEQSARMFAQLQRLIDGAKKLLALIGQPAAPLAVEAWVNGTPLTDADLKGKVVLLDFWAVWCGPCIATFPHLREWNEKYADKGLVTIGLTNYYGMVWDEAQGRAVRPAPKPAAKETDPAKPAAKPVTSEAKPAAKPAEPEAKPTPAQEQEMLKKFAEHHKLHHRFAIQKDKTLAEYYAVSGIPHVVVIDRAGKIQLIRVGSGEKNAQEIEAKIVSLIGGGAK